MFVITIIIILLFRKIIKMFFKNLDYHILFRSFFCLYISTMSIAVSVLNWNLLITNPLGIDNLSLFVNNMMLSYMIVDTVFYLYKKNYRLELMFHHIICLFIYGFLNIRILSFCAINEILSSYNWIGILYPNLEWISKLFRLYSIIFVRLFVWIFVSVFLYQYQYIYQFAISIIFIFICLDIYWTWIIIKNYLKYREK